MLRLEDASKEWNDSLHVMSILGVVEVQKYASVYLHMRKAMGGGRPTDYMSTLCAPYVCKFGDIYKVGVV